MTGEKTLPMWEKLKKAAARLDGLSPRAFWCAAVGFTLLRCFLTWHYQMAYTWIGGAPLDDELMFRAAQCVSAGQWLGAYDWLTLSKAMFFPVWLAFLHAVHVPYLAGGALLWCAASFAACRAFAPLLRTRGRQLALYLALAFAPSSWAAYTLRVYRDNIFPALCLLFFAGWAGAALRAVRAPAAGQRPPRLWPWLVLAGAGLAAAFLDREDAGLFLLPFAGAATLILLAVFWLQKRLRRAAALAVPYAVLAAGVTAFCALNYTHYGVWALSDFSEGAFADAMGAMTRVETASTDLLLSVPADARARLYAAVPELAPLQKWLEEDTDLQNSYRDRTRQDYRAGSFYWAVRRAAASEGLYADATTAAAYWRTVAEKVNAACDDGTLPSRYGRRSSTAQPVTARCVLPTLKEAARSFVWALEFIDCPPYEALRSIGTDADVGAWSDYLSGTPFNLSAEVGKDTPYYTPAQHRAFALMDAWRLLSAVALSFGFFYALLRQFRALPGVCRARRAGSAVPWLLLFGLLGMALLRCAMIAFVEISSFGIGTYTMYLASVHPLLILYAVCGSLGALPGGEGGAA